MRGRRSLRLDTLGYPERTQNRRQQDLSALPPNFSLARMNNDEITRRTFELIDSGRDELVSFLSHYIQHRSINPERQISAIEPGETTVCQKWLCETLQSFGCFETVRTWRVSSGELNIAAQLPASEADGHHSALFNGHSDVVPVTAAEFESWRGGDPWSGQVYGGAVYGRGACDMKGGRRSTYRCRAASLSTSAICSGFRPVFCSTCSRQLNPSVTTRVPESAARTAGNRTRSPSA
jgi:hypothetical protein